MVWDTQKEVTFQWYINHHIYIYIYIYSNPSRKKNKQLQMIGHSKEPVWFILVSQVRLQTNKSVKRQGCKGKQTPKTLQCWWSSFQLMGNCWFGARWFGYLGSPKMKGIGILRGIPHPQKKLKIPIRTPQASGDILRAPKHPCGSNPPFEGPRILRVVKNKRWFS